MDFGQKDSKCAEHNGKWKSFRQSEIIIRFVRFLGLLGMYFDAVVVEVEKFFRLARAIL